MNENATGRPDTRRERWLLVAYYANCEGRASSHHVHDRLDEFAVAGVDITLLSSICGARYEREKVRHLRAFSLMPSGSLYEISHCLRRSRRGRGLARGIRLAALLPLMLPVALAAVARPLERLVSRHDKRWWWWPSALLRALPHVLLHRPDVVYTIGGPSSSHAAGRWLARLAGVRLVCQFQDPLPFQYPPSHPWRHRFHERFERTLAAEATPLVFLTEAAAAAARRRLPPDTRVFANLAGAAPRAAPTVPPVIVPGAPLTITHIGTLADTRNLDTLLAALTRLAADDPSLGERFRLRLAGTLDRHVTASIERFTLRDSVEVLGKLERAAALALADESDVLLLVQHRGAVSGETIPSKAYEYLCATRPVLGLVDDNAELVELLREHGHLAVRYDDGEEALAQALHTLLYGTLPTPRPSALTAAASVRRLVARITATHGA